MPYTLLTSPFVTAGQKVVLFNPTNPSSPQLLKTDGTWIALTSATLAACAFVVDSTPSLILASLPYTATGYAVRIYAGSATSLDDAFTELVTDDVPLAAGGGSGGDAPAIAIYNGTLSDAQGLAAAVPAVASWTAASDGDQLAALVQARLDIDGVMMFQGQKYDCDQELQFPRVPYDDHAEVWDYDSTSQSAIVPIHVKLAELKQAQAIVSGEIAAKRDRLARGLTAQATGSVSESYASPTGSSTLSARDILTPAAQVLLDRYRLRSGRLL